MLDSNYDLPRSFYFELARRCSILKTAFYSARLRGRVIVGRGSRLRVDRSASVEFAPGATLVVGLMHDTPAGAVLRMKPRSSMRINGRVQLMRGSSIAVGHGGSLTIGGGTFFNDGAMLVCHERMTIGDDCAIAWGARLLDTDVHTLTRNGATTDQVPEVRLGDRCWIGAGATVVKGVSIGPGAVVAASSVVTRDVPEHALVGGVPAQVLNDDVEWKL